MFKNNDYSIILPTLNEAGHIKDLISEINNIFILHKLNFEIIIIDDNSTDGTVELIRNISKNNNKVSIYVRENKKDSLVQSLIDGIKIAKYERIIWMDADFSHPPNYINEFIRLNNSDDYDALVFSRFLKDSKRYYEGKTVNAKTIDNLSFFLNKICQLVISDKFTDYTSGFICIKKEVIKNTKISGHYGDYFINLIFDLIKNSRKITEIPYIEQDRASGKSKTTGNKIDLIIKCFFYGYCILKCSIKKLI